MIVGRDLLNQLNIDVRFSDGTIKWEDQVVRMKKFQRIWEINHPSKKELKSTILRLIELRSTKEVTERVVKILDSKYEKTNNLDMNQKQMLPKLLT